MGRIEIEHLHKRFGRTQAVDDVSLTIEDGEFFALLGPSGCGKTTLLRILAGLEVPDTGRLSIDGQDMAAVPPNRRPVNMVFQSYAVFPHMSVADNVAYGLRMEGAPAPERERRTAEALALVRLGDLGDRRPDQLSGGQRQRVALARALVKRPKVLLLDEPLSALDAKLREQMRFELKALQRQVGITFVMVTHDQSEAMALADRCAVMNQGRLEQVSSPSELYHRPVSRFVAEFIGQVNLIEGELAAAEGGTMLISPELGAPVFSALAVADGGGGEPAWAAIRPERISLTPRLEGVPAPAAADAPVGCNRLAAVVREALYLGGETIVEAELDGGRRLRVRLSGVATPPAAGAPVWLYWAPDAPVILTV
jgi:spermidine/putrescine transport system ATP-binding protein